MVASCPDPPYTCFHHGKQKKDQASKKPSDPFQSSIVDYVLVAKQLFHQLESCRVLPQVKRKGGRPLFDHAPILTTVRLTPAGGPHAPSSATGSPPRIQFHSSKLKNEADLKMFSHMVETTSLAQRPHLARLKQKAAKHEITPHEFAAEANHIIIDILQHAAENVLGRVRPANESMGSHSSSTRTHYTPTNPKVWALQTALQKAKEGLRWAKKHAPEQLPAWTTHRNKARSALYHEKHSQKQDSLLGDASASIGQEPSERAQSMWFYLRRYKTDHAQSTLPHKIYSNGSAIVGLRWKSVGDVQPRHGCGLLCDDLAAALQRRTDFSLSEFQNFRIRGRLKNDLIQTLRPDNWIQSGSQYFRPLPADHRIWIPGPLTTCARAWHAF